MSKKLLDFC